MIWLLHLAARDGVAILGYADTASGTIRVEAAGQGRFTEVVLHPRVAVAAGATLPDGSPVVDTVLARLHDEAQEHVRDIITDLGEQVAAGAADAEKAKIGAAYASFMDTERIESVGLAPLEEDLAPVRAAGDKDALLHALAALQRTGAVAAVAFFVDNDAMDPERYVVHLTQSGLGLPDEAYYRDPQYAAVLAKYRPHVARMLALAGWSGEEEADAAAGRVLDLETKLASHHWDVVKDRDAELTYNAATLASLVAGAPGFAWGTWVAALGAVEGSMDS
ncbi:MAG: hypothetical protein J0I40_13870, partial [Cellulomonas sp.]|nr:hypothetical protein [Cellulomonas sp.]